MYQCSIQHTVNCRASTDVDLLKRQDTYFVNFYILKIVFNVHLARNHSPYISAAFQDLRHTKCVLHEPPNHYAFLFGFFLFFFKKKKPYTMTHYIHYAWY